MRNGLPDNDRKLRDFVYGRRENLSEEEIAFFEAVQRDDPVQPAPEELATEEEIGEIIFIHSPHDLPAKEGKAWLSGLLTKYAFDEAMRLKCRPDQFLFPTKENLHWAVAQYEQERFFALKPWDREKCVIEGWNARNHRLAARGIRVYNYPAYWKGNGGTHEHVGDYDQKERALLWRRWRIENGIEKIPEKKEPPKPEPVKEQPKPLVEKPEAPARPEPPVVKTVEKPRPKPKPADDVSWL